MQLRHGDCETRRVEGAAVTATIGPGDIELYESPRPELLRLIAGVEPELPGTHVMLEPFGIRSTQRLLLSDAGGSVVAAFWPAELKSQAEFLFSQGRGVAMVRAALARGWHVWAVPQLAFFNSRADQRLYMAPGIDPAEYARRWEGGDGRWIGQHARADLKRIVWPWLKERGYSSDRDDPELDRFLAILGRRPAHLRPALRFHRHWNRSAIGGVPDEEVARIVRGDVNAVLDAADEPPIGLRRD